jgi:hypothetical protein
VRISNADDLAELRASRDPARALQLSLQRRATLMTRRAQENVLSKPATASAEDASSEAAAPAAVDVRHGSASSSSSTALAERPTLGSSRSTGPPQGGGPLTNFELERLFITTSSPATAAALRQGGTIGQAAEERVRQAVETRRRNTSESFVRSWDAAAVPARVTRVDAAATARADRLEKASAVLATLPKHTLKASMDSDACAICQQGYERGARVIRLPCTHLFHADCITKWLQRKLTCPLDNLPIEQQRG